MPRLDRPLSITMKHPLCLRLGLLVLALAFLPSCGSAFRQAWKHAPASTGVEGKWEGTWLSAVNGHTGTLKCVVTKSPKAEGHEFFYRATWKKILSGSYKATHHVEKKSGTYAFKGDHLMPDWAGGKYHYEGTVKVDAFSACYESAMDRGTYTMKRVK